MNAPNSSPRARIQAAALATLLVALLVGPVSLAEPGAGDPSGANITVYNDISYGPDPVFHKLNVYLPDPAVHPGPYPCYIVFHGGGFVGGSRYSQTLSQLCHGLASEGIVTACADYTIQSSVSSWWPEVIHAAYDAIADVRLCFRFVEGRAAAWNLDPGKIFMGGASCGASIALHGAINDPVDPGNLRSFDGVAGVVSMWGSLYDRHWHLTRNKGINYFQQDDPPACVIHGTADTNVPYECALEIAREANEAGVALSFHPLPGEGHAPWHRMDDIIAYTRDFILY